MPPGSDHGPIIESLRFQNERGDRNQYEIVPEKVFEEQGDGRQAECLGDDIRGTQFVGQPKADRKK